MSDYDGPSKHIRVRVLRRVGNLETGREYPATRYPKLGTIYVSGWFVKEGNPTDDPRGPEVEVVSQGLAATGDAASERTAAINTTGADLIVIGSEAIRVDVNPDETPAERVTRLAVQTLAAVVVLRLQQLQVLEPGLNLFDPGTRDAVKRIVKDAAAVVLSSEDISASRCTGYS